MQKVLPALRRTRSLSVNICLLNFALSVSMLRRDSGKFAASSAFRYSYLVHMWERRRTSGSKGRLHYELRGLQCRRMRPLRCIDPPQLCNFDDRESTDSGVSRSRSLVSIVSQKASQPLTIQITTYLISEKIYIIILEAF